MDDVSDIERLTRKLGKRITEYFNGKYKIDDFVLLGLNLVADIDVDIQTNALAYLKVLRKIGRVKGFPPAGYECFNDNASLYLSGSSNSIDFLLYDLEMAVMRQWKSRETDWKKWKPVRRIFRANLLKDYKNIFMDTFTQII